MQKRPCRLTGSLSPGDQGLAKIADVEHSWCLDIIPVLLGERVHTEEVTQKHQSTERHRQHRPRYGRGWTAGIWGGVTVGVAATKPVTHALLSKVLGSMEDLAST